MPEQNLTPPKIRVTVKGTDPVTASPKPVMKIPTRSLSNAKAAFKHFSLSKFPDASAVPNNFVANGQQVSAVQHRTQINQLKSLDASGRRLRVALSDSALQQQLPSFNGKTVVLQELMDLIQRKLRGTEFYAAGDPTLVRLSMQSQVNDIIQTIKSGSDNKPE